jgi:anti-sigma B factor antagonist
VLVVLEGEIDLSVREQVAEQLEEGAERATAAGDDLQVDLAKVTFIDSTGLNAIVRTAALLVSHGRRLRLCAVPPTVLRLLELTGLCDLVERPEGRS